MHINSTTHDLHVQNVVDHSGNSLLLLSPTGGTYVMSHTFCSSQPTMLCKAEEGSLHFCVNIFMRRQHKTVSCVLLFMLIQSNFTLRSDPGKNNE